MFANPKKIVNLTLFRSSSKQSTYKASNQPSMTDASNPSQQQEEEALIGIIGGTGLGDTLSKGIRDGKFVEVDTPFGKPSDAILVGHFGNRKIAFLNRHGRQHTFNPSSVPYAANIFALKQLGVKTLYVIPRGRRLICHIKMRLLFRHKSVVLTFASRFSTRLCMGAVGSLVQDIAPGDLVLVDQFIDKTMARKSSFFDDYGAVHVEMADPACTRLRNILWQTAQQQTKSNKNNNNKVHRKGTYVCMEGPSFSTRAEALMHKAWGGHLIGMTALPECKLAREAQMCYALIALVSDYDCWKEHDDNDDDDDDDEPTNGDKKKVLLQEIIANMDTACTNCVALIEAALQSNHVLSAGTKSCRCRSSLELAVWTAQDAIPELEKKKLKVLFE